MSKKSIEQKIPKAMNILDLTFKDVIPSSYNGYISSFGASIIQSGLEPTLALSENENASTLEKKQLLPKLILNILDENSTETSLLKYVLNRPNEKQYLKREILDIAIAIKLCIRTFKLEKPNKGSQNE